jgi:hypothetical protein
MTLMKVTVLILSLSLKGEVTIGPVAILDLNQNNEITTSMDMPTITKGKNRPQ